MNKPSIKLPDPQEAYAPFIQRLNAGENAAQLVEEAYEQGVEDFRAALIAYAESEKETIKHSTREEEETESVSKVIGVVGTMVLVIMALAVIVQQIFLLIT